MRIIKKCDRCEDEFEGLDDDDECLSLCKNCFDELKKP